ncbi:hypothetical protein CA608_20375 [Caulobacter vibrioides]|nr:hypothetical protein CA608_20375 [Caulobacter vibrioides]
MERETWDVGDSVAGWSRNSERPLRHAAAPRATSPVSRGRRMTLRPPAPLAGRWIGAKRRDGGGVRPTPSPPPHRPPGPRPWPWRAWA